MVWAACCLMLLLKPESSSCRAPMTPINCNPFSAMGYREFITIHWRVLLVGYANRQELFCTCLVLCIAIGWRSSKVRPKFPSLTIPATLFSTWQPFFSAPFVHFNKGAACVKIGRDPVKLQKGLQEWKGAHLSFDVRVMRHVLTAVLSLFMLVTWFMHRRSLSWVGYMLFFVISSVRYMQGCIRWVRQVWN